jgi:hypothetical protein
MQGVLHYVRHVLALVLMVCGCSATQAATSSVFPPTQQVQGTTLSINGSGTRYKVIFKLYDMALYTPRKVKTAEDLLALPGPKRLNFVALRDLPGTDLGLVFIKGLSSNATPDLVQKHTASSTRLIEIFSGRSKLVAGDTFAMEYVPGKGTTFYIQDQPQGAAIGDAEFFNMVLKIWVGPVPADFKLKDALLGQ